LIFQIKEETTISESLLPTQDGGNSSDTEVDSFKTKEERSWMFMVTEMKRTETSLCGTSMVDSTNNGILSMLINIQRIQPRVNSTKTSV
jgi:hypothetical protein